MKVTPSRSHSSAKAGSSATKPQPTQAASAPVSRRARSSTAWSRYGRAEAGPEVVGVRRPRGRTSPCRSPSVCRATVWIACPSRALSSRTAWMSRMAASPRFTIATRRCIVATRLLRPLASGPGTVRRDLGPAEESVLLSRDSTPADPRTDRTYPRVASAGGGARGRGAFAGGSPAAAAVGAATWCPRHGGVAGLPRARRSAASAAARAPCCRRSVMNRLIEPGDADAAQPPATAARASSAVTESSVDPCGPAPTAAALPPATAISRPQRRCSSPAPSSARRRGRPGRGRAIRPSGRTAAAAQVTRSIGMPSMRTTGTPSCRGAAGLGDLRVRSTPIASTWPSASSQRWVVPGEGGVHDGDHRAGADRTAGSRPPLVAVVAVGLDARPRRCRTDAPGRSRRAAAAPVAAGSRPPAAGRSSRCRSSAVRWASSWTVPAGPTTATTGASGSMSGSGMSLQHPQHGRRTGHRRAAAGSRLRARRAAQGTPVGAAVQAVSRGSWPGLGGRRRRACRA